MIPRGRILFKLTPLLDLLLIMLFAYQIRSSQVVAETTRLAEEDKEAARHEAEFRRRVESDARDLRDQNDRLRAELREMRERLETARTRVLALAVVLHEVAREITQDDFARMLSTVDEATLGDLEEAVDRVKSGGPAAVLRELTRFQAVRKHVTLWTVHLPGNERILVRVDDRDAAEVTVSDSAEAMRNLLGRTMRELEEPKDLVIVFFSWDRVLKDWKDRVGETLHHLAADTLKTTYPGKRFHVSPEGYVGEEEER